MGPWAYRHFLKTKMAPYKIALVSGAGIHRSAKVFVRGLVKFVPAFA